MTCSGSVALVVVDVQRYYTEKESSFCRYSEHRWPGSMDAIHHRVELFLIPAVQRLKKAFYDQAWPVIYLRLCGNKADRSDLHRYFRDFHLKAEADGFGEAYPLVGDTMADIAPALAPAAGDIVLDKTTYSGFTSTELDRILDSLNVNTLVMTGLATSQCVDSTARDASDRGYTVVFAEDGLADYSMSSHRSALYASMGVCGGHVADSSELTETLHDLPGSIS